MSDPVTLLLPDAPVPGMPGWIPGLIVAVVLLLVFGLQRWSRRSLHLALRLLRRDLLRGRLDARDAAHHLARLLSPVPGLQAPLAPALDRLRFARPDPDALQVLALLEQARALHGRLGRRVRS